MLSNALSFLAIVAMASAQVYSSAYPVASHTYVSDSPHVGLQSEQTVRGSFGSSISHQQKAVDSAFSSVRKTDTRITNPAVYAAAPAVYSHAAPVYQHTYAAAPVAAAPVYSHTYAAAPVAAPVYSQTYAPAPVRAIAAAPLVAKAAYAAPAYAAPAYAAPAYAAPVASYAAPAYAAPAIAKVASPLLGVQYSGVNPAVATLSFDGFGVHYGY